MEKNEKGKIDERRKKITMIIIIRLKRVDCIHTVHTDSGDHFNLNHRL